MPDLPAAVFAPVPDEALVVPLEQDAGAPSPSAEATEDSTFTASSFGTDGFGPPEDDSPVRRGLSNQQGTAEFNHQTLCDVLYEFHPGVVVQTPMGEAGRSGDVVRVHSGFWTKVVEWTYERLNAWPDCPHPDTGNPNEILLYAQVQPAKPAEGPNGARIYRVRGRFEYRLVKPLIDFGPFPTATSPESMAPMSDNTLRPSNFVRGALFSF